MTWTVPDLTGDEGELIERFCYSLHDLVGRGPGAVENVLLQVAVALGADVVRAELVGRDHDAVERRIATRSLDLVGTGVDEVFLVRALRDYVTRTIESWTDVEKVNRNRAEALEAIGHELSPQAVQSMQPLSADEAAGGWAARDRWRSTTAEVLSDAVLEVWGERKYATLARHTQAKGPRAE